MTRSTSVKITRQVTVPDQWKVDLYNKVPELGPRILFFSGGTALKRVSKRLIDYTHNAIHIITAFDSGGSSAKLREAFGMIAIGDLRNRLMALADQSYKGHPEIYRLFAYRFPADESQEMLRERLRELRRGHSELIASIREPMKSIICNQLKYLCDRLPRDFDLRGANIGNLILAGGYLNNNKDIDTILYIFSKLIGASGVVKPVVNRYLHLAAELESGELLAGQHLITGKACPPIESPIRVVHLISRRDDPRPVTPLVDDDVVKLIERAELICYPMGSFYSSLIANLLPEGIGAAIAGNPCPKVFVPNTLSDPEQLGMNMTASVDILLRYLRQGKDIHCRDLLNFVVVDSHHDGYPGGLSAEAIRKLGVGVIDTPLVTKESYPYICPDCMVKLLLSLA